MEYQSLVDGIDESRKLIVAALQTGDLAAVVPTCPDFTLDRLAFHIGEFSSFWTHVVCEATGRNKPEFPPDPGAAGIAVWVDGLIGDLIDELGHASADTPCWTWNDSDQSVGFTASRACHEFAIHRVDTQLAAMGKAAPVDPAIAAAGIEEVFMMLGKFIERGERGTPGRGETLHLHGTDFDPAEWLVRLDAERPIVTREHAKGDLAIKASVSDLEMLLYQRPTIGDVEWFGDRSVLDVFHGEFTFD